MGGAHPHSRPTSCRPGARKPSSCVGVGVYVCVHAFVRACVRVCVCFTFVRSSSSKEHEQAVAVGAW